MDNDEQVTAEVDRLRRDLLNFVISELASRVASGEDIKLAAALREAIDREVARSVKEHIDKSELPDVDSFLADLLARAEGKSIGARAAYRRQTDSPKRSEEKRQSVWQKLKALFRGRGRVEIEKRGLRPIDFIIVMLFLALAVVLALGFYWPNESDRDRLQNSVHSVPENSANASDDESDDAVFNSVLTAPDPTSDAGSDGVNASANRPSNRSQTTPADRR